MSNATITIARTIAVPIQKAGRCRSCCIKSAYPPSTRGTHQLDSQVMSMIENTVDGARRTELVGRATYANAARKRRQSMLRDSKAFSGFAVDDLEKAKAFYGQTLGLPIAEVDPENGVM